MERACGGVQELLGTNIAANLQLVVQVAKEYTEQLGAGKIIEMLEAHKSYHGLYYYLGSHIAFSEDPEARCPPACRGIQNRLSCSASGQGESGSKRITPLRCVLTLLGLRCAWAW